MLDVHDVLGAIGWCCMTGPFGREPRDAVKDQWKGFQASEVCECPACSAFGVDAPPVAVPSGGDKVGGKVVAMCRWVHGFELAEHLRATDVLAKLRDRLSTGGGGAR